MAISSNESISQASINALEYMEDSIKYIDRLFGEGYAKQHPELVGAFIQTCAIDYLANRLEIQVGFLQDNVGVLGSALSEIGETIGKHD